MWEARVAARPFVVRLVLALIAASGFLCACNDPGGSRATDRQAEYEGLLASYDRPFIQYLARAQATMGREVLRYSPISGELAIPKRIDISGSHRDLGSLLGHISQQCGRQPPRVTAGRRDRNGQIIEMYRRVYPQYLDLVGGVGDVFGVPPEDLDGPDGRHAEPQLCRRVRRAGDGPHRRPQLRQHARAAPLTRC